MAALKWCLVVFILANTIFATCVTAQEDPSDDFAEFEEDDDQMSQYLKDREPPPERALPVRDSEQPPSKQASDDKIREDYFRASEEVTVEDEIDVEDDDEEIFEESVVKPGPSQDGVLNGDVKKGPLEIVPLPVEHMRHRWESYIAEIVLCCGLVFYMINFLAGRSKNQNLANKWLEDNELFLKDQFALVGDDGRKGEPTPEGNFGGLLKETESHFTLWCSGRNQVDHLMIELNFIKRHDILSVIINLLKPTSDILVGLHFSPIQPNL